MRSISHCLNKQLVDICQRSVQLEELTSKVKHFLPQELAKECQVGSFNKGCLILTITHPGWASQLRYAVPELRDRLRKEAALYQLTSIKVILVEPAPQYEKIPRSKKNEISQKAKATIISESLLCTYEPLQKALLHLAEGED